MRKILFFIFILAKVYCINLPDITSNKKLMGILESDLLRSFQDGDKDRMLFETVKDASYIGIDFKKCSFDINEKFLECLKIALENGNSDVHEIINTSETYLQTPLSIAMLKDLGSILHKGAVNALNKCDVNAYYKILQIAKDNNINQKAVQVNDLQDALKKGLIHLPEEEGLDKIKLLKDLDESGEMRQLVSNEEFFECFLKCLEEPFYSSEDIDYLVEFAAKHNIDTNKYNLQKTTEKILVKCLNVSPYSFSEGLDIAVDVCDKFNQKFELSQVPDIEKLIYKNIHFLLSEGFFQYLKQNHINIDFSKVENLHEIFDHNLFCTFSIKRLKDISKEYDIEIDYSYYANKQKKVYEDLLFNIINFKVFFHDESDKGFSMLKNSISKILEDAKENDINININEITRIKNIFSKGLDDFDDVRVNDIKNLAIFFDIKIDANNQKNIVAELETDQDIIDLRKINIKIDTSLQNKEIAIIKGLAKFIEDGVGSEDLKEDLLNSKLQPYTKKAIAEIIRKYVSFGDIEPLCSFIKFSQEFVPQMQLSDVEDMENIFYEGLQNAANENNQFVYYYLLLLAENNHIILNNEKIKKCDGKIKSEVIFPYLENPYKFNPFLFLNVECCGHAYKDAPYMTKLDMSWYANKYCMTYFDDIFFKSKK